MNTTQAVRPRGSAPGSVAGLAEEGRETSWAGSSEDSFDFAAYAAIVAAGKRNAQAGRDVAFEPESIKTSMRTVEAFLVENHKVKAMPCQKKAAKPKHIVASECVRDRQKSSQGGGWLEVRSKGRTRNVEALFAEHEPELQEPEGAKLADIGANGDQGRPAKRRWGARVRGGLLDSGKFILQLGIGAVVALAEVQLLSLEVQLGQVVALAGGN